MVDIQKDQQEKIKRLNIGARRLGFAEEAVEASALLLNDDIDDAITQFASEQDDRFKEKGPKTKIHKETLTNISGLERNIQLEGLDGEGRNIIKFRSGIGCQTQVLTVENGMQTDVVQIDELSESIKSLMGNKLVKQTSLHSHKASPQKLLDSSLKMLVAEKKKNRKAATQNL